ncbi:hypothetical protein BGZ76_002955 [Entomortierella beljakovae]|nr:hypothetical protein BGZ76_002955 [Entomortierella beljakovae]
MDASTAHRSNQHRPPVLFQSEEHVQLLHRHLNEQNDHLSSPLHPLSFGPGENTQSHALDFDQDDLLEYRGVLEDEPPAHIHSQSCRDSCPVQDIYTEITYSRFSKGARTNLYGLVVVKELEHAIPPPPSTLPATLFMNYPENTNANATIAPDRDHGTCPKDNVVKGSNVFTAEGNLAYSRLPGRYVLVAAGSDIKCFMGLNESFEFSIGHTIPGSSATLGAKSGVNQAKGQEPGEDPTLFELRFFGANTFGSSIRELLLGLPKTTDIQSIALNWAPTKIIHIPMEVDPFDMGVLVAGSDSCVHYFAQEPFPEENRIFAERSVVSDISILSTFPYCEYCVLSLVIKDYLECRVVAAGTQNGTLNISIIPRDSKTLKLDRNSAKNHSVVLFAPITTLTFFTSRTKPERRKEPKQEKEEEKCKPLETTDLKYEKMTDRSEHNKENDNRIHLLVTCAIEQVWVYSDINKHGLARRSDLAECSYHDSILTAYIMDADWDGFNEIMIGTYGRQLMVFKELPEGQTPFPPRNNNMSDSYSHLPSHFHSYDNSNDQPISDDNSFYTSLHQPIPQWSMTWNRRFASPVYGISSADLNDDGLEELVITSLNGVSIFLPDPLTAKRRLAQAVDRMREIEQMRLTLEKLRKSNEKLWEKHEEKQGVEISESKGNEKEGEVEVQSLNSLNKKEEEEVIAEEDFEGDEELSEKLIVAESNIEATEHIDNSQDK